MKVVVADVSSIQSYVFRGNLLRESIGASRLVSLASDEWVGESLKDCPGARLIYAAGGNAVVEFDDDAQVTVFAHALSHLVITRAPGLNVVLGSAGYDGRCNLAAAVQRAFRDVADRKQRTAPDAPLMGLGVTAACRSTGLAAVGVTDMIGQDPSTVVEASAEVLAKRNATDDANQALRVRFGFELGSRFDFATEFDQLGRDVGESSRFAVVHIDGNSVGKRFQSVLMKHQNDGDACAEALRVLSREVTGIANGALARTISTLIRSAHEGAISAPDCRKATPAKITLESMHGKSLLPFRPILLSGDDFTFVCDARVALPLAAEFLKHFGARDLSDGGGPITACAGIAMVKAHYPFAWAYDMAETLCQNAKRYRMEHRRLEASSCMDWDVAAAGSVGVLHEIRDREYRTASGRLSLRPVTLDSNPIHPYRSWEVIDRLVAEFQGPEWSGSRSKAKDLAGALMRGPDAVRRFLTVYREGRSLPDLDPEFPDFAQTGWHADQCGYFDAIELMDYIVPLSGSSRGGA